MKTIKDYKLIILILAMLPACGQQATRLELDPDGYGKTVTSNGIRVLVNQDKTTSLTAARILIGGGVLTETAEDNGVTNLMINMLMKGNSGMTAAEITEQLDFLGAEVFADCYRDYSAISFVSLTENFEKVLEIISQSLLSPTFPPEELAKLKQEMVGRIKASNDSQSQASNKLFWKTAYGDQGYGLPTLGTEQSLADITPDDIKRHYHDYLGGSNMVFSMVTDLPAEQVGSLIDKYLSGVKSDAREITAPARSLQEEKTGFIKYDRNQSFIFMGEILDHLAPEDVPYVVLLNEVMGNNVGSRLWYLRQKEKLAYAVYTQYIINEYGAAFLAAIGTDTSKVKTALSSLNREWDSMVSDGITAEELRDAKVNMKNNLIYRIDRKSNRANNMAYYEYIGYGYHFILDMINKADNITLDELNQYVKNRFTSDKKFVSIVGKR